MQSPPPVLFGSMTCGVRHQIEKNVVAHCIRGACGNFFGFDTALTGQGEVNGVDFLCEATAEKTITYHLSLFINYHT